MELRSTSPRLLLLAGCAVSLLFSGSSVSRGAVRDRSGNRPSVQSARFDTRAEIAQPEARFESVRRVQRRLLAAHIQTNAAAQDVVINEFLADPPIGTAGDANGDGTRDSGDDEFIELVNRTGSPMDVSGWKLSTGTTGGTITPRHTFASGTVIPAGESAIVFGGGTPTGTFGNTAINGLVFTASSGLSLTNSPSPSLRIELKDSLDNVIDSIDYTSSLGNNNQSGNRNPDITGSAFALHNTVPTASGVFSPGRKVNQAAFTTPPSITTLSPPSVAPNSGQFLLTINGSNFDATATARIGGTSLTTLFNSTSSLTATVSNSFITAVNSMVSVQVVNGQGDRSNIVNLITGPQLDSISPTSVEINSGAFTLTANGQGFSVGAIVRVESTDLTPATSSSTQLQVTVPNSLIASLGSLSVKVINSNGGPSVAKTLSVITTPPPSVSSVNPSGIQRGSGDTPVTVTGSAFKNGAAATSDGVSLQTSFTDSSHLTATVTAAILATAGSKAISVTNPDGQSSGTVTLNIYLVPAVATLSPAAVDKGSADFTLIVTGSGFQNGAHVKFDATDLGGSFFSQSEVRVLVTAALVTTAAAHTIKVFNPGSPDSNGIQFLVQEPAPSISTISPTSVIADSGDFTLTVNGSNYQSGAKVNFAGTELSPVTTTSTKLTVEVTNNLFQTAGNKVVFVKNPDNRTSGNQTFNVEDRGTRTVVINEFLADPPIGTAGDANGDGTRDSGDDEFIELVNRTGSPMDVSGWKLSTGTTGGTITPRHTFASGTVIPAGEAAVVFGGGTPTGAFGNATANGLVFKASGGLSLTNSPSPSERIELKDGANNRIDAIDYTSTLGNNDKAGNLNPDATGNTYLAHDAVAGASGVFSPGRKVNQSPFTTPPAITSLSPAAVAPNSGQFSLTINGTDFDSTASAKAGGTAVTTTFNSSTSLTATIPNSLITAVSSTVTVQVTNGQGDKSNTLSLITGPRLDSISPSSVEVNSGAFTLTANGQGFSVGAIVRVESTDLTPSTSSSTQLQVTVPNNLITSLANLTVKVINSNGGPSLGKTLAVTPPPPPSITAVSPDAIQAGSGDTPVTVTGGAFKTAAVVKSDGVTLQTSFIDSSHLTATVTTAILAVPGPKTITVVNPDNQTSGGVTLRIFLVPVITMLIPPAIDKGSAAVALTVMGSNFQDGAVIAFDATDLAATLSGSAQLQTQIPTGFTSTAASHTITVRNPGTPPSNPLPFVVQEPAPIASTLTPASVVADSGNFTLTINGSNFLSGAHVSFDGTELVAATVTAAQVTVAISNSLVETTGIKTVFVKNSDGRTSGNLSFNVENRGTRPAVINEFLADPPGSAVGDLQGDANGDGSRSSSQDEFVEIVNRGSVPLDISGWKINTGTAGAALTLRHTFAAGAVIPAGEAAVVFGGGAPAGSFGNAANNGLVFTASTGGLSLLNTPSPAARIELTDHTGTRIDIVEYTSTLGNGDRSGNLNPDRTGNTYTLHDSLAGATGVFSPGRRVDQSAFTTAPVISSVSPPQVRANTGDFLFTVFGSNFDSASTVRFNNTALNTTFLSASELRAAVSNSLIGSGGQITLRVIRSGGNRSNAFPYTILPELRLDSLSPASVFAGDAGFTLTLIGTGFEQGSHIRAGGNDLFPASITETRLDVPIDESLIVSTGTLAITVVLADGTVSNSKSLGIDPTPAPSITFVSPESVPAGVPSVAFGVNGKTFRRGSVVMFDGADLPTTFFSRESLQATVGGSVLSAPAAHMIQVRNPDQQRSNSVSFRVLGPPPLLGSISPQSAEANIAVEITATGSNFQDGAMLLAGNNAIAAASVTSASLRATIPASLLTAPGGLPIAVRNPDGQQSAALTLTITPGLPHISVLTPSSAVADSGDLAVSVSGSNLMAGASVLFDSVPLSAHVANAQTLSFTVPNSSLQVPGAKNVIVKNPDGLTSPASTFTVLDRGSRRIKINEFLADPPDGQAGDANRDGVRSSTADEFIELFNPSVTPVDISAWTISDATQVRHTFAAGSIVPGGEAVVVFGGGSPAGAFGNATQNGLVFVASTGTLSLGNTGDTIELKDAAGARVDIVIYASSLGDQNQSANLLPDVLGSVFALHTTIPGAQGSLFSPGQLVAGTPFTTIPSLMSIDPSTIEVGPNPFTLAVNGDGFSPADVVTVSGQPLPTEFVSGVQLRATVPASIHLVAGARQVRVLTVSGSRTAALTLDIFERPVISELVPRVLFVGAGASMLEAHGSGFQAGARVQISGLNGGSAFVDLPATFVSATVLRATVEADLLLEVGQRRVRVLNPDSRLSNEVALAITLRPPSLLSLAPSKTHAGHPTISLSLIGSDFQPGAAASFDDVVLATVFVSPNQLTAELPANLLIAAASHAVRVINPDGQSSSSLLFAVSPLPVIDRTDPPSLRAGRRSGTLTITGANFQADAIVRANGEDLLPSSRTSTSLVVNLTSTLLSVPGTIRLTVVNGDGGESSEIAVPLVFPDLPSIVINEILADPPAGTDVNGDGIASTSEDEFVEIVNTTRAPIGIGGYSISDATSVRHVFTPGTVLPAGEAAIVFGGGNPVGLFGNARNNSLVFRASSGTLSLNNSDETITLRDALGTVIQQVHYGTEGGNDQSLTLDPDVTGDLVLHTTSPDAAGARFSPGTRVSGQVFTVAPRLDSISPPSLETRTVTTITLTGQGFLSGARVLAGGTALDPEFVSPTELRFTTAEETFEAGGSIPIQAVNPSGNRSNAIVELVVDLGPSITSLTPTSVVAGAATVTVSLVGRNFHAGSRLSVDGADHALDVTSETAAQATFTAPELAVPGRRALRVVNEDGRRSNQRFFDATISIEAISPQRILKATSATLIVTGGGFRSGAVLLVDGTTLATSVENGSRLTASLPGSMIESAGRRTVAVRDSNGTMSNAITLLIHDTPPTLSSLNPPTVGAGASAFALTVTGSSFQSGAQVRSNGVPLPTAFVSASQLSAQMPESAVARSGAIAISVENPDGGISSDLSLSVSAQPLITRLSAARLSVGSSSVKLQILGLTFQRGAVAFVNDAPAETVYRRSTRVDVTIPGSLRGGPATLRLRVVNPDGGRSNVATIDVR